MYIKRKECLPEFSFYITYYANCSNIMLFARFHKTQYNNYFNLVSGFS